MKLPIVVLFLFLSSLTSCAKCVYVSSSIGDDNNTGLSVSEPLRTISKAMALSPDTLFLKAGDVFYEALGSVRNMTVTRYGKGENPTLCGFKRIRSPHWEPVGENLWMIDLTEDNFSGFYSVGTSMENNIGCIYDYETDEIHGRRVQYKEQLVRDWDFWQTEQHGQDTPASEFSKLYLFLKQDPNQLPLQFSVRNTAASVADAVVEKVDFVGFGFGIAAKSNSIIRGCKLDVIGGRLQLTSAEFVNYGNGIEFYVSSSIENCLVEDCSINCCYDCGVTIQGSGHGKATPRNIHIRNNMIKDCCQGWEDFLRNAPDVKYDNCTFEKNMVLNSGENGFGYPDTRFKYCHVLGNNVKGDKGMIIRDNVFVGGNYYCSGAYNGKYMSNVWDNNTCYIKRGDYLLGNYSGTKDVIRVPEEKGEVQSLKEATDDAVNRYHALTGDQTTKFVVWSDNKIQREVKRLNNKWK